MPIAQRINRCTSALKIGYKCLEIGCDFLGSIFDLTRILLFKIIYVNSRIIFWNINTLVILATKIFKNHGSYFVFAYKKQPCYLSMQTKIVLSSISFGLAHQCSVLHSFEQKQQIVLLISNYFYRHHRCRIFVSNQTSDW